MKRLNVRPIPAPRADGPVRLAVPPDRSITDRIIVMNALAEGVSIIENPFDGPNTRLLVDSLRELGVGFSWKEGTPPTLLINSPGRAGFKTPSRPLNLGDSDTALRLLAGALAGGTLEVVLDGSERLRRRNAKRLFDAIAVMGGEIQPLTSSSDLPVRITGAKLRGVEYELPPFDSRLKSALVMAGLQAAGQTVIRTSRLTRDHTERMLEAFQVPFEFTGTRVTLSRVERLSPINYRVFGDPSAAAAWVTLSALKRIPIEVDGVYLNPTRMGFFEAARRMGVPLSWSVQETTGNEPVGKIRVGVAEQLTGLDFRTVDLVDMIDDALFLSLLATQAKGETLLDSLDELRSHENNRFNSMLALFRSLGATVEDTEGVLSIRGTGPLWTASVRPDADPRIALLSVLAALTSDRPIVVAPVDSLENGFPGFWSSAASILPKEQFEMEEL